ncbi:hypothetical protein [Treponema sp.]|uniref:hypothetical protein n=1 Tax=Treponema sp. TaxID=166 RepID=UPI0025F2A111|nr:hypothetical protein [Treponema sp.]MCR5218024.1 hypothetical protein [Treponema sp.]
MPAYSFIKKTAALLITASLAGNLYCDEKNNTPSVETPAINTPSIPEIKIDTSGMHTLSAPTIGEGFYTPNTVSSKIYDAPQSQKKVQSKISDDITTDSGSLKKVLSSISAQDLSTMSELGMLDSLDSSDDSLEAILSELRQIKEQNSELLYKTEADKSFATPAKDYVTTEGEEDSTSSKKAVVKPKILRFSINSYDILRTCRKIYISSLQEDGAFLVTGDRRYLSDGKTRSETFYLYFNIEKENGTSTYTVTALVSQDYLNEYSFIYQLSQKKNLTATRTGNLLTMHTADANWQLDFLVDLGDEE